MAFSKPAKKGTAGVSKRASGVQKEETCQPF